MLLSRNLLLPLAALIGAVIVDGVIAAATGSPSRAWTGWPVVAGLAVLVVAALYEQVSAATDDDPDAAAHFAAVNGQTTLLAATLIIVGVALLLGTTAPGNKHSAELSFAAWAGATTALMGFVLTVGKAMIGTRKTTPFAGQWTPGAAPWRTTREQPQPDEPASRTA